MLPFATPEAPLVPYRLRTVGTLVDEGMLPPGGGYFGSGGGYLGGGGGYGGYYGSSPSGSADPVTALDFSTPPTQPRPTTASELASFLGCDAGDVQEIWTLEGASGSIAGHLGNYSLNEINTPLRNQTALCFNGTDWVTRKAAEVREDTFNGFVVDTGSVGDLGTANNVAVLIKCRVPSVPTTNRCLAEKRDGGFGAGWELRLAATGVVLLAEDALGTTHTAVVAADTRLFDGAWHYVLAVFDFTNSQLRLVLDFTTASNSSVLNTGESWTSVNALRFMTGWNRTSAECQVDYCAVISGASVASITGVGDFWKHGSDVTGVLTTATHANLLSDVVANDATLGELVQHWHGGSGHGIDQLPYGYHAANTQGPNALGCWLASTNLLTSSEDFSAWGVSTVTRTYNDANDPNGMRRATKIAGSFATSYIQHTSVTVSGNSPYTMSVWLKLAVGTSGSVLLRYTNGVVNHDKTVTVTDKWQRFEHAVTTEPSGFFNFRVYAGDGVSTKQDVHIQFAMLNTGSVAGRYARSLGGTKTVAKTVYRYTSIVPPGKGEIQVTAVVTDVVTAVVKQLWDSVGNPDRRRLAILSNNKWYYEMRNAAGTSFIAVTDNPGASATVDTEYVAKVFWQQDDQRLIIDDVERNAQTQAFTFSGTARELCIGHDNTENGQLNGYISKVDVYDQVVSA